jgi:hypothetical protein
MNGHPKLAPDRYMTTCNIIDYLAENGMHAATPVTRELISHAYLEKVQAVNSLPRYMQIFAGESYIGKLGIPGDNATMESAWTFSRNGVPTDLAEKVNMMVYVLQHRSDVRIDVLDQ